MTVLLVPAMQLPAPLQEGYRRLLGSQERLRYQRLRGRRRQEFLLGRVALRELLSRFDTGVAVDQWHIAERRDLPPRLLNDLSRPLYFSIAHSGGNVAVAVSDVGPVGIDIEGHKPREFVAFARHWFHSQEADDLQSRGGAELGQRFYQLWTLKEACIKLTSSGIFSGAMQAIRPRPYPANVGAAARLLARDDVYFGWSACLGDLSLALATSQRCTVDLVTGLPLSSQRRAGAAFGKFSLLVASGSEAA